MSIFKEIDASRIIDQTVYFFIIKDAYPVSPGHLLIISRAEKSDFFALSNEEKEDLLLCIDQAKSIIESEHQPDGYNIGMNCGEAAGQTIFHFHCHLIPRYQGDIENPRGGIRNCIPGKGNY